MRIENAWSDPPSQDPGADGSAAPSTPEGALPNRAEKSKGESSDPFADLRRACTTYQDVVVSRKRTQQDLVHAHAVRDLRVGIALDGLPDLASREVTAAVARFDSRVAAAAFLASDEAPRAVVVDLIKTAHGLLVAELRDLERRLRHWRRASFAAFCGGLATVLVGAGLAWAAPSARESAGGLGLAVLGAAVAVAMTHLTTGLGRTTPTSRGLLATAPLVVLTGVILLQCLRRPPATAPGTVTVVTVVTLALLTAPILFVVLSRRSAARDVVPGPAYPSHVAGSLVAREVDLLQRKIRDEGRRQAASARRWQAAFLTIGGFAALTSGSAAVTALNAADSPWVVVLALLGGVAGGLVTALNPGSRWSDAKALAVTCDSLADEVGALLRLDLGERSGTGEPTDTTGREQIEKIAVRFDAIRGVPARARLWPLSPH